MKKAMTCKGLMVAFLRQWYWVGLSVGLLLLIPCAWAYAGQDVLDGTLGDVSATIGGAGRKWMYVIEGVSALIAYRSTKNVYVLGSVIAVAIFINVLLAMAR
jgi:hypothetical protein